jgi:secreted trypsin-like serine protease
MRVVPCPSGYPSQSTILCVIRNPNFAGHPCNGDSGGYLGKKENGVAKVMGVFSFYSDRCTGRNPTGYVNVYLFVPWIKDVCQNCQ